MRSRNMYFMFSILFSIAFIFFSASSQEQQRIPLSLFGGVSMPVNEFGSSTGTDAGFAKLGYSISLEHDVMINEPIRLFTTLTLSSNLIDQSALRQKTLERIAPSFGSGDQFKQQFVQLFENNTSINERGSYYSIFFLTGPEIQTQVLSDFILSGAAQIGLLFQSNPLYRVIYTGLGTVGQGFVSQPQTSRYTFAFALSGGVEIGRFKLCVKYLSGQPKYDISRSYMMPARIIVNSNIIDIPESSKFGTINIAKEPTSVIVVLVGFVLSK